MLLLLPPSEGKAPPPAGRPLELDELAYPELTAQREKVLDALVRLSAGSSRRALERLGLSAGQAPELARNAALREAPAAPAAEVYTGVLFERLGLSGLPPEARERADDSVLIASALWGILRPGDRIPAYRLSMGARLPRFPGLAAWWRPALERALPDPPLAVDLRSAAYAAAWTPRSGTVVAVRAFAETPDGTRRVVSHMAKRARGDVARALLLSSRSVGDPEGVATVAEAAGLRVELGRSRDGGRTLDVVEPAA